VTSSETNKVGIVGLGYVGLPLAVAFAEAGMKVIGVDADNEKVAAINSGASYIEDVPSEAVARFTKPGDLRATADYSELSEADAVLICVPTPLDENRSPDLGCVVAASENVARHLSRGALVVLESTTYPGTTREVLQPILERSGRKVGEDFFLAFSPERVDPGNKKFGLGDMPKVVGGITPECGRRAGELYELVAGEVHTVSKPESAEFSKLLENIFRGVNIALVNELAMLCERMDVDVWEVVEAAGTKPFGFMQFFPGPGLGGHCIPIDPFYLAWRARSYGLSTEFIELAGRVNVGMPHYVVDRVSRLLNEDAKSVKGSEILILGVSYKPDVGDLRESPSIKLLDLLADSGARVSYHDPHVPELEGHGLATVDLTGEAIGSSDCVIVATDHSMFDLRLVVDNARRVFDLRNAVRKRLGGRPNGPLPENVEVL
jgi:UDP-N-acetyl-D-glucosamine dehydrogenase